MSHEADTTAEQALLMELAHLGMGMARKVHEAALATDDTDQIVALAQAYHHMSRGVRQSLALRARFAAGTVAPAPRAQAIRSATSPDAERPERDDAYERPDWHTRLETREAVERLHADDDVNRARIARDLTVVSRTPALAAIPALQAPAAALAGRAALLTGASLRLVNTS
ncbi:hypothetical protein [Phenylobacterium sp.]|uniref:hypothetical protein n=1 Tax=Phenylobacterium sp. TaxID=1871053 RepID=UPI003D266413